MLVIESQFAACKASTLPTIVMDAINLKFDKYMNVLYWMLFCLVNSNKIQLKVYSFQD